jgi:hypothetical protein
MWLGLSVLHAAELDHVRQQRGATHYKTVFIGRWDGILRQGFTVQLI